MFVNGDSTCPTFILAYVLESKGQASVLPLDDAHLAESTFAYDSKETEVIEVDCVRVSMVLPWATTVVVVVVTVLIALRRRCRQSSFPDDSPSSVKTTGFPLEFPIGAEWLSAAPSHERPGSVASCRRRSERRATRFDGGRICSDRAPRSASPDRPTNGRIRLRRVAVAGPVNRRNGHQARRNAVVEDLM